VVTPNYKLIYGIIKGLEALEDTHGIDVYGDEIVKMTSILCPLISVDFPDSYEQWNDYFEKAFEYGIKQRKRLKKDQIKTFIVHCFDIDTSLELLKDL
jgi:hypothetical protein